MQARPTISVVMATYNGGRWLTEQLQSIINQSRPPDEIIVVDDCSTDNTREYLQQVLSQDQHKIILNRRNIGSTQSFAKGIEQASGDIIFISDQDDIWDKDKIKIQTDYLITRPRIGLVWSELDLINEDGAKILHRKRDSHEGQINRGQAFHLLMKENTIGGLTMAFKKDLKKYILPIPDLGLWHDYWIAVIAAVTTDIERLDVPLVHYRLHSKNQLGVENRWSKLKKRIHALLHGSYNANGDIYIYAYDRLKAFVNEIEQEKISCLRESAYHHMHRKNLPPQKYKRIPLIFRELVSGHYHKYSTQGFFSALQDFLVKPF